MSATTSDRRLSQAIYQALADLADARSYHAVRATTDAVGRNHDANARHLRATEDELRAALEEWADDRVASLKARTGAQA